MGVRMLNPWDSPLAPRTWVGRSAKHDLERREQPEGVTGKEGRASSRLIADILQRLWWSGDKKSYT